MIFVLRILPVVHYRRMGAAADDFTLLERYAASRDEAAFAQIVRRHLNLVYSAALRRVGDRHMAEDVTQAVFVILAGKPRAVGRSGSLGAWLLMTVRYAAANAIKLERRRRRCEASFATETAGAGGACSPNPSDVLAWQEMAAHLDDAVLRLPALDRRAVVMRFFEQKSIGDVAEAMNVTEAAAKQRLSRSIDKLRQRLARRGTLAPAGAAGLSTLLAAHAVSAAPPGVLASTCAASAASAGAGLTSLTIAKGAITMMTWTKIKVAAAIVVVASVLGTGAVVTLDRARADNTAPAAGGGAPLREKANARVGAAEKVLALLKQREDAGEALTPDFVELKLSAQRRLADARIDAATDRAPRLKAAEEYVEQCRAALAVLEARNGQDVTPVQVAQGAYQLADAEYLLAKLRGGE